MKLFIVSLIFVYSPYSSFAQKFDNQWLFGYDSHNDIPFGGTTFDFSMNPIDIFYEYRDMDLHETNASICNKNGELQFYTNGIYIANKNHEIMENGGGLNPGDFTDAYSGGLPIYQGAIILPFPDHPNEYFLIHETFDYSDEFGIITPDVFFSQIDMSQNNGLGAVVEKNQILLQGSLDRGKITAVKHANGRDWWIIVWEFNANIYNRLLATPSGISNLGTDTIGLTSLSGIGQAVFSPDGTKYVRYNSKSIEFGRFIDVYDFDRCTGLFSNQKHFNYFDESFGAGAAISPNSRFLYLSSFTEVYQYDLWADDIEASIDTVAIYDGFTSPQPPFGTTFYLAQLAPDGKIYFNSTNGVMHMHVINEPNQPGELCDFQQHSIETPTFNAASMPNFPNYRLGPLPNSPCDTLSDFYRPAANFEFDTTTNSLLVDFLDISTNDPTEWQWTFEDNISTTEQHPQHTFSSSGTYEVCLVASNLFGSDTTCQEVTVEVANAIEELIVEGEFKCYPNPVSNELTIENTNDEAILHPIQVFNSYGKIVKIIQPNNQSKITLTTNEFSSGIYFIKTITKGKIASVEKITVIR